MQLVIAEKVSVAITLAKVLGVPTTQAKSKKEGYFADSKNIVTWCQGHLVGLADPEFYKESYTHRRREDLPMLPDPWHLMVYPETKKQYDVVKNLLGREEVNTVVSATDCGREGELIFRLVYQMSGSTKPVKRLWISSMEDEAIRRGFENLRPSQVFDPLYQSALARMKADWLVGMNMSRLFSLLAGQTYHVGRVVSPTLAMVVERYKAVIDFVPTPFYTVVITTPELALTSERMSESKEATNLAHQCNGQTATITQVETKEKCTAPPKLYDLTTLQRDANRQHGFTATQTLNYAQSLYLKKLITYPRTDSRYVTQDMKSTVGLLFTKLAPTVHEGELDFNLSQVINDKKVTDHHALLPTKTVFQYNASSLPPGEQAILHMITQRLVMALTNPHRYLETKLTAQCCGKTFQAKGRTTVEAGFMVLVPPTKNTPRSLPPCQEGDTFSVEAQCKEGQSSPPKYYTDDTLLAAMANANQAIVEEDEKGLGTPATRASILEKLVNKGYITREGSQKVKTIQPTTLGQSLIQILPEELRSPVTTAKWEDQLQKIAQGQLPPYRFLDEITTAIKNIIVLYKDTPSGAMSVPGSKVVVGKCPRCGGNVVKNSKGYNCVNRDSCAFAMWKDSNYFKNKRKTLTDTLMHQLLTMEKVVLKDCIGKDGKPYDMEIQMVDNGSNMDFKMIRFINERT